MYKNWNRQNPTNVTKRIDIRRWAQRLCKALLCWALIPASTLPALADEQLRLSGFGTIGYVTDNRSDIAPARDITQLPEQGFRTGSGWKLDSRIGLQLEYLFSPVAQLVGQVVLRDHFKSDLNRATDLAYLALTPFQDINLRVGRVSYDAFLMSDHRHVGYAYQWVRPPSEFYSWIPLFSFDGLDAAYTLHDEESLWRIKLQAGNSRTQLPVGTGYDFHAKNIHGLSISRQAGSWRLKAAYSAFKAGSEAPAFAPLHHGLDQVVAANIPQISAEAADLRRNLSFKDARISYATLGAAYDDGVWLGQAEMGRSTASADVIPHGNMAYASIGRRFGQWTPSLTLSTSRPTNGNRPASNNWGALNPTVRDPAIYTLNSTRIEQDTLSLGTRWDFNSNAAVKLQWDRTEIKPSGYGAWWRDRAINLEQHRIEVLSATLDFSF